MTRISSLYPYFVKKKPVVLCLNPAVYYFGDEITNAFFKNDVEKFSTETGCCKLVVYTPRMPELKLLRLRKLPNVEHMEKVLKSYGIALEYKPIPYSATLEVKFGLPQRLPSLKSMEFNKDGTLKFKPVYAEVFSRTKSCWV